MNENAAVGTFVGSLKVEDLDEGSDGMIECWSTNPHVSLEAFDEKSYGVVVANELDYEDSPQVNISITCSDHGIPRLTTSTTFIIYVLDVNDNAPQFTQSVYNGSVKESIEGGQKVVQVLALDKDGFNNNQVMYSLGEADERLFTMDATTGWVRLNVSVDREHTPMLTVVVFATDSGSPPLTGTATVTVSVEDINDNVPYLNKTDYYISEAVPCFVADEDIDVTSPFIILTNGSIEVNKKLNRETQNETRLVVFLRDKGTPALTGSGTLTLHIVAYNDEPPQFLFPSPLNKTAWIGAEAPLGSHVCRVQTADGGLGAPQNVLYNIAEGNADNWFGINSRSGELFVARSLLPLAGSTVQLKISSANTLNPQMLSYGDLEVTVGPSNASLLTRAALGAQDSYVIVAGIISGVTVIIAVVIISVIVHLRTTDLRRMQAAKSKATRPNNVNSRVPIAVSFVPEVKGEKLQKTNTTLTSSMGGKNAAFTASEKGGSAVLKPTLCSKPQL
ncbi:hypothetical protein C0Q70_05785 [Pomacea canaliculata]|uniref:Cadherin domain-containing protein n=1 Tax=Pomacea canaliculata TaxID=400727 RepID=A0A2T7PM60_POMCA|nr:hypothetical protein C0Q70_05785 [Pomacea canaliculata]